MYIADQTKAPPGSEIMGQFIANWTNNLEKSVTEPIFKKYGLDPKQIKLDGYYSLDIVVDLYTEIRTRHGGSPALVAMGKASGEPVQEIFKFKSVDEFMARCAEPFKAAIRNIPEEYGLFVEKKDHQHYHVTNNSIVPNDMIFGYLWEMVRLILGPGVRFSVKNTQPHNVDSLEGAIFEVSWV